METSTTPSLDVTGSLGPAWTRMKEILFPFDIGTWFAVGLMVFMEMLAQGSTGNLNLPDTSGGPGGTPSSPAEFADLIDEGFAWVEHNMDLVILVGVPVLVLAFGLYILLLWLSARGQLMLARAVAKDDTRVGENWRATRFLVGSLLKARLVLDSVTIVIVLGAMGSLLFVLYRLLRRNETEWQAYLFELGPIALAWFVGALLPGVASSILRNFVVPLMLHFQESCAESFRRFLPVLKANVGAVVVFFVLRALLHVVFGMANVLIVLMTCCIGGLPVVNQAITAPFHVFDRAWSMCALRSLGRDYDLFAVPVQPPSPAPWAPPPGPSNG
ncbi:MAG: hypothetical protein CVU63_03970 [Deltaproteobacteria bacterium HGW-Deltaproteobacteria-20]|jgi:hypothetical protein|nr:MAG: hypothetical protein CVU63_03970 [Deltaproteobacteria bacterium HGW-Deltaproteobacteria-20]